LRGKTKEKRKECEENPKKKRNERKLKKPGSYFHQGKKNLANEKKCRIRPKDIKGVCPTNDCSKWDDFTIKNVLKNLVSFSAQKQAQQNSDPNVQVSLNCVRKKWSRVYLKVGK
jgi:hypothetical protein